jgi:hypothetical protein
MWTFLALAGRLVSPLLAFVPGLNPKVLIFFAGCLAVLTVIGGPAGAVWLHMRGEVKAAATAEKTACELSKAEAAQVSAETLAHLLDRIAKLEDDDEGKSAKELCASSPFCRTRGKK